MTTTINAEIDTDRNARKFQNRRRQARARQTARGDRQG
jgi:hypothetical protein